jgi:hypothetical protein
MMTRAPATRVKTTASAFRGLRRGRFEGSFAMMTALRVVSSPQATGIALEYCSIGLFQSKFNKIS